jgi:hypothetical protein
MDRVERQPDEQEVLTLAMEGKQAEIWTSLPGIIESYDPAKQTATVQPAVQGVITDEAGNKRDVNLPLLLDVPVEFPSGGGFTLTFPVKPGDECVVEFQARCIDGWWKDGGVRPPLAGRMHDLSDGICRVGVRSQKSLLSPPPDADAVELRSDDNEAKLRISPDKGVLLKNPKASLEIFPDGRIALDGAVAIGLTAPVIELNGQLVGNVGVGGATINSGGDVAITAGGVLTLIGGKVVIKGDTVGINDIPAGNGGSEYA